jgi:DNA mismatch endonuclease (patch repair protein)
LADSLAPRERSERKKRIRSKDTGPEMAVRRLIHGMGYRYRLHRRDLAGRPDLTFGKLRKVIFVHGCFWHRHADSNCKLARLPKSRLEFWLPKLERDKARDQEDQAKLAADGWSIIVLWECELKNIASISSKIRAFLSR